VQLHRLGDVDREDLLAYATLKDWDYRPDRPLVRASPCGRPHCHGSFISSWGTASCHLCSRPEWPAPPVLPLSHSRGKRRNGRRPD